MKFWWSSPCAQANLPKTSYLLHMGPALTKTCVMPFRSICQLLFLGGYLWNVSIICCHDVCEFSYQWNGNPGKMYSPVSVFSHRTLNFRWLLTILSSTHATALVSLGVTELCIEFIRLLTFEIQRCTCQFFGTQQYYQAVIVQLIPPDCFCYQAISRSRPRSD